MSANAQYILLLVVAVALTFLVGQLLVRAGEPFLFEVFQDRKVTRSVNLLLSVLFYLITLGVLVADRAEGMKLHMRHAHNLGITCNEMRETIFQVMYYAGQSKGLFAMRRLKEVMQESGATFKDEK